MYCYKDFQFLTLVLAAVVPFFQIFFGTQTLAMVNDAPLSAEQPSYFHDNIIRSRADAIHQGLILAFSQIAASPSPSDDGYWEELVEPVPPEHVISTSGRNSNSSSSKEQDNTKVPKLMGVCQRFTFGAAKSSFEVVVYGMPTFSRLMHLWKVPAEQLLENNSNNMEGKERFFLMTKSLFPEIYETESQKQQQQQQFTLNLTYKFDVKGSVHNQKLSAKKRNPPVLSENGGSLSQPTFRYLDLYDEAEQKMSAEDRAKLEATKQGCFFRNGILLEDKAYKRFIDILTEDALLLKKAGKTDYSLLLGITFDKLNKTQMEMLKKENSNILVASCENCSADHGQSYSKRIDNFTIIPGIIDTLAQFNWRKIIDLVLQTVVKHKMEKKEKSAIGPDDYYYRFMCAISTKVFRPPQNESKLLEVNIEKFCNKVITEPSL